MFAQRRNFILLFFLFALMAWTFINFDIVAKRAPQLWKFATVGTHQARTLLASHKSNQFGANEFIKNKSSNRPDESHHENGNIIEYFVDKSYGTVEWQAWGPSWMNFLPFTCVRRDTKLKRKKWIARRKRWSHLCIYDYEYDILAETQVWWLLHYIRPAIYIYVIRRANSTWIALLDRKNNNMALRLLQLQRRKYARYTHRIRLDYNTTSSGLGWNKYHVFGRHILHVLLFIVVIDSILTKTNLNAEWMTLSANS